MPAPDIFGYWGKARPAGSTPTWHPLVFHSLDVAACADVLLRRQPRLLVCLSRLIGLPAERLSPLIVAASALHDLGKFTLAFQLKGPDEIEPVRAARERLGGDHAPRDLGHPRTGAWLWSEDGGGILRSLEAPALRKLLKSFVVAANGHHGAPANDGANHADGWSRHDREAARTFARTALRLFGLASRSMPDIDRAALSSAQWLVAGLVNLADWVGSDQAFFPYRAPPSGQSTDKAIADYWVNCALPNAECAVARKGLAAAALADDLTLPDVLDEAAASTPLQTWAREVPLDAESPGPRLAIIEDFTGAGKTEAALLLAHRLMRADCAGPGLYWALPTQATSNAIFARFESVYQRLYAPDNRPSLALAHGERDMYVPFREALARGQDMLFSYADNLPTAEAICAAWLADDRRTTFFADVAVGTVDQAMLAVLPSRFNVLRLLGLSQRVLVIDEAHSFDNYMNAVLERLITFQTALGGSTILLSATLSTAARQRFVNAFAAGAGAAAEIALAERGFPYAAAIAPVGADERACASGRGTRRDLPVRRLETPEAAEAELAAVAAAGGCAVYVRNTVDTAIESYRRMRAAWPALDLRLFHARFALCDRMRHEQSALATFGKESRPEARRARVLIATQVIEQSLDLDFDAMASDLAPIDLLIQRTGRLQRHPGRPARPEPHLLLVAPPPIDDAGAGWLAATQPGTAAVYRNHARLWAGAGQIDADGGLRLASRNPRDLLDEVYERPETEIPPGLQKSLIESELARGASERAQGLSRSLDLDTGYSQRQTANWLDEAKVYTRLDEPPVTVRLARWDGGSLRPWADGDGWDAWKRSELRLAKNRFERFKPRADAQRAAVDAIERCWRDRHDETRIVALAKAADGAWTATVTSSRDGRHTATYSPEIGWHIAEK